MKVIIAGKRLVTIRVRALNNKYSSVVKRAIKLPLNFAAEQLIVKCTLTGTLFTAGKLYRERTFEVESSLVKMEKVSSRTSLLSYCEECQFSLVTR